MRKGFCFFLIVFLFSTIASGEDFTIQTFAGGGLPQNIHGTLAVLHGPAGIVSDASGNAYFTLMTANIVLRLDSSGVLTLMAGSGTPGFSGDGGLATNAQLNAPWGIALDGAGSLYIADSGNARIRKVQNGVISTIAGGGTQTADNSPAVDTVLTDLRYVAADAAGNVYVDVLGRICKPFDTSCSDIIRKITNGVIATIAGTGTFGYSGDGGPATSAQLAGPGAMAIDAAGALYFSDAGSRFDVQPPVTFAHVRKIQNGVITTVANVTAFALAVDQAGNLFVAHGSTVQEISNGVTTMIAGSIDNGAIDPAFGEVFGLNVDKAGNVFIASQGEQFSVTSDLIRKVSNGVITTVAGEPWAP